MFLEELFWPVADTRWWTGFTGAHPEMKITSNGYYEKYGMRSLSFRSLFLVK
jgi:hypothetical protein